MVGCSVVILLQIVRRVWQKKNSENWLTLGEDMANDKVGSFFETHCIMGSKLECSTHTGINLSLRHALGCMHSMTCYTTLSVSGQKLQKVTNHIITDDEHLKHNNNDNTVNSVSNMPKAFLLFF